MESRADRHRRCRFLRSRSLTAPLRHQPADSCSVRTLPSEVPRGGRRCLSRWSKRKWWRPRKRGPLQSRAERSRAASEVPEVQYVELLKQVPKAGAPKNGL